VSRIAIGVLAGVIVLGGVGVTASANGWLPLGPLGSLNPEAYVGDPPSQGAPVAGLSSADAGIVADAASIQQRLAALDLNGVGVVSYSVTDLAGTTVAAHEEGTAAIPASAMKILTSLGALSAYGADHRFATTVVDSPDGIILVGGGDPALRDGDPLIAGQATLATLADATATALTASGRTSVALGFNDSLFSGPMWHPNWPAEYGADVAPISALSASPQGWSEADTAADAAAAFARLLGERGITVTAVTGRVTPAADTASVASILSPTLGEIVQHVVTTSYNFGAEVLLRHVSLAAGGDGSFSGGAAALSTFLQTHGLWSGAMTIADGSGLARENKVPPAILAAAVRTAYKEVGYHDVLNGLPVAGVTGTLSRRFDDPIEAPGRGVVRAKTGTLDDVHTITGFVQANSGAIMVFSFMVNQTTVWDASLNWLDGAATVLATS
jgi:D-alanyl-D-alanine carboxypeptidase/D-alanyl-D-alanine-endopeptidase (penicillin-binding protein 4)